MFDFDSASKAWMSNKIKKLDGSIVYKCNYDNCIRQRLYYSKNNKKYHLVCSDFCKNHQHINNNYDMTMTQ